MDHLKVHQESIQLLGMSIRSYALTMKVNQKNVEYSTVPAKLNDLKSSFSERHQKNSLAFDIFTSNLGVVQGLQRGERHCMLRGEQTAEREE